MIGRIARLTAAEFMKLFAQPFLYIAFAAMLTSTLLGEWAEPLLRGQRESVWKTFNSIQLFSYGMTIGLRIATYVLLIFSSMMFAGEFDRGTIKNLLTRPITRAEFFIAKCVTVVGLAAILFGFVFYVSLAYALTMGDLGPVWDDSQYIMQRSGAEILAHARKAVGLCLLSFLAAGFFGILVSNLTESSGFAVAIGLVVFLTGDVLLPVFGEKLQQRAFLYYIPYAMGKLAQFGEGTTTRWNADVDARHLYLKVPLAYIAAFIPLAFSIFRTRNITA